MLEKLVSNANCNVQQNMFNIQYHIGIQFIVLVSLIKGILILKISLFFIFLPVLRNRQLTDKG